MDEQNQQKANSQKGSSKVWIVVAIIVLVIAGLAFAFMGKKFAPFNDTVPVDTTTTPDTTTTLPPPETTGVTPPVDTKKTVYKSGTYTAIGNYISPGGAEGIQVTVTLVNNVITDSTVVSKLTSGEEAIRFQSRFISGFKSYVIGKNIDEVNLSRVSGSSLTPRGWNDAISKIKAQASA